MTTHGDISSPIVVSFICFYSVVFLLSTVGNLLVLFGCYRTIKGRGKSSRIKWFIANLAFADLTFTALSVLNAIGFLWTWLGGTVSCKMQGFLIEACYTTSILTLVVISFERRKAVVSPFSARTRASDSRYKKRLIAVWIASLVIGSPLLYAYTVEIDANGSMVCNTDSFGDLGKQVYYSIHAVCIFIVPLTYMIYAQSTIFLKLRSRAFLPTQNAVTKASSSRHRKVAKILAALTVAFTVCWAPFIIVRALMHFHLADEGYVWRVSQLLILLNTALDPILYGIYGENMNSLCPCFFTSTRYHVFAKKKGPSSNIIELSNGLNNCVSSTNSTDCVIHQERPHNSEERNDINQVNACGVAVVHHF